MRNIAPQRWHRDSEHRTYGIKNWFEGRGVTNPDLIKLIKKEYKRFTGKEGGVNEIIQGNFSRFCSYALKRIEAHKDTYQKHKPKKTKAVNYPPYLPPVTQDDGVFIKIAERKDKISVTGPGIGIRGVREMMAKKSDD